VPHSMLLGNGIEGDAQMAESWTFALARNIASLVARAGWEAGAPSAQALVSHRCLRSYGLASGGRG
jgi:hypothetical protein